MGYDGLSRSNNSEEDIDNDIMPIALMTKQNIEDYCDECEVSKKVRNAPVYIWRFIADAKVSPASYHHTGAFYRMTPHYDLDEIADYIKNHKLADLRRDYKKVRQTAKDKAKSSHTKLCVAKISFYKHYGQSCQNYRWAGNHIRIGFIEKTAHQTKLISYHDDDQKSYLLDANRVVRYRTFDNLKSFKKKLGRKVDLRKFKAFLRKHHVSVSRDNTDKTIHKDRAV